MAARSSSTSSSSSCPSAGLTVGGALEHKPLFTGSWLIHWLQCRTGRTRTGRGVEMNLLLLFTLRYWIHGGGARGEGRDGAAASPSVGPGGGRWRPAGGGCAHHAVRLAW